MFYHGHPIKLDEEVVHSYDLEAVIDLSAGNGQLALTCIRQRKPYFGITLTEAHSAELINWLTSKVWSSFLDESSKLYVPALAKIMAAEEGDADDPAGSPAKKAKGKKGKATGQAAPSKPNADTENDDNDKGDDQDPEQEKKKQKKQATTKVATNLASRSRSIASSSFVSTISNLSTHCNLSAPMAAGPVPAPGPPLGHRIT